MKETGEPRIERMVREAIEKHVREEHISVDYPPMWMAGRRGRSWLPLIVCALGCLAAAATFAALASTDTSPHLAVVMFCFTLLLAGSSICAYFPLEYTLILNFVGVSLLQLGTIFILVEACVLGLHSQIDGLAVFRVGGPALTVLGFTIFGFTALVSGPWQLMVGSPFLATGLLFRCCAALLSELLDRPSDTPHDLQVAAVPFIILALLLVGTKAFTLMKKPWLLQANYFFYGIFLFSCGILLASVLLLRKVEETEPHVQNGINVLASFFTFLGSSFFLLRSARAKDALNITLEDRYPAMKSYIWNLRGFIIAAITLPLATGAIAFAAAVAAFYKPGEGQDFADGLELGAGVCVGLFAVGAVAVPASKAPRLHLLPTLGLLLIAGGLIVPTGAFSDRVQGGETSVHGTIAAALGLAGSLALFASAVPLSVVRWQGGPGALARVLFHPGNYVLLCSLWFFFAFSVKFVGYASHTGLASKIGCSILANVLTTWALLLLILHTAMARYLYQSYHKHLQPEEEAAAPTTPVPEVSPNLDVDVMICGAGPVGLLTATVLAKSGASVVIVELRDKPIMDARFLNLNSATVELMEQFLDADLFAELQRRAWPNANAFGALLTTGLLHPDAKVIKSSNTPSRGVLMENLDKMDAWTESRTLSSRYASQLSVRIMQSHQETVLKMQAERLKNVKVMYGWKVDDFQQYTNGVLTHISSVNTERGGGQQTVRSKYMVGSDGPGSFVSKQIGFKFDGLLNLAKVKSLLVRAPGVFERILAKIGSTHQYQIIRRGFGIAGIVAADPTNDLFNFVMVFGDKAKEAEQATVVKEFMGITDGEFEIVASKEWYWNFFVARSYRSHRVFLCGDSAHSWPPFGGLGGNTGYQDAFNLGWKLAAACKGWGSELLLDSYSSERRQAVLKTAMYVMRSTPRPDLLKQLVNPVFDNWVLHKWMGMIWYWMNSGTHGANHFSQSGIQFGVRFTHSPCIMENKFIRPDDPSCQWSPNMESGSRLPAVPDKTMAASSDHGGAQDGLSLSTYTLILPNASPNNTPLQSLAAALRAAFLARGVPLAEWHLEIVSAQLHGNKREMAQMLEEQALLIVRPDRTIAWSLPNPVLQLPDSSLASQVASTITGLDVGGSGERICRAAQFKASDHHKLGRKYLAWLTDEFLFNLRPFTFQFPKSIPVQNQTKDVAIAMVKEHAAKLAGTPANGANKGFAVTTKYQVGGGGETRSGEAQAGASLGAHAEGKHVEVVKPEVTAALEFAVAPREGWSHTRGASQPPGLPDALPPAHLFSPVMPLPPPPFSLPGMRVVQPLMHCTAPVPVVSAPFQPHQPLPLASFQAPRAGPFQPQPAPASLTASR